MSSDIAEVLLPEQKERQTLSEKEIKKRFK